MSQSNETFLNQNRNSALHVFAAARTRRALDPSGSIEQNQKDILSTLENDSIELEEGIQGLRLLREWETKPEVIAEYVEKASKRWPEATAFRRK